MQTEWRCYDGYELQGDCVRLPCGILIHKEQFACTTPPAAFVIQTDYAAGLVPAWQDDDGNVCTSWGIHHAIAYPNGYPLYALANPDTSTPSHSVSAMGSSGFGAGGCDDVHTATAPCSGEQLVPADYMGPEPQLTLQHSTHSETDMSTPTMPAQELGDEGFDANTFDSVSTTPLPKSRRQTAPPDHVGATPLHSSRPSGRSSPDLLRGPLPASTVCHQSDPPAIDEASARTSPPHSSTILRPDARVATSSDLYLLSRFRKGLTAHLCDACTRYPHEQFLSSQDLLAFTARHVFGSKSTAAMIRASLPAIGAVTQKYKCGRIVHVARHWPRAPD